MTGTVKNILCFLRWSFS